VAIAPVNAETVKRFATDLDRVVPAGKRIGIAVSGGPDSLALLLLAAAARPGEVEAASVDHALRSGSRDEAEMVASLCEELAIPHAILTANWDSPPASAIQEKARAERYRLLLEWVRERGLEVLATAHHADDQAETLLMRLARGAGVRGLAGMRAVRPIGGINLVRPLLGWSRSELREVCDQAGAVPAQDPSNDDEQFERVRIRRALSESEWADPKILARSAANLAAADRALQWATDREWRARVRGDGQVLVYAPRAPLEIRRRIASRVLQRLAGEGGKEPLRGRELDRLMAVLHSGRKGTLRGVLCTGGKPWRFERAPRRRATAVAKGDGA
jgi:tRNA(Ile)-lysidine synthase